MLRLVYHGADVFTYADSQAYPQTYAKFGSDRSNRLISFPTLLRIIFYLLNPQNDPNGVRGPNLFS